uniref:hypothetical protein n=1 Tax=Lactobacillus taiwanensis TaxID=508451 RepID=UPI002557D8D2
KRTPAKKAKVVKRTPAKKSKVVKRTPAKKAKVVKRPPVKLIDFKNRDKILRKRRNNASLEQFINDPKSKMPKIPKKQLKLELLFAKGNDVNDLITTHKTKNTKKIQKVLRSKPKTLYENALKNYANEAVKKDQLRERRAKQVDFKKIYAKNQKIASKMKGKSKPTTTTKKPKTKPNKSTEE